MTIARTKLCLLTAAAIVATSLTAMGVRHYSLAHGPAKVWGPGVWKVTLLFQGSNAGMAELHTAAPASMDRQQILHEECTSEELSANLPANQAGLARQIHWSLRTGIGPGPIRARYEFYCATQSATEGPDFAPAAGEYLQPEPGIECRHPVIADCARRLVVDDDRARSKVRSLYAYVSEEVKNEPRLGDRSGTALQCCRHSSGDSDGKSRLLAALCRQQGIPARLVSGLILGKGREQPVHVWVEAWVDQRWLAMCPFYRHLGRTPQNYLIITHDGAPVVQGRQVDGLAYAFLVERSASDSQMASLPWLARLFTTISLEGLPPAEQRVVDFLLLLPVAALMVCIFRVIIGLQSFGTFAPALLALCFRELKSWPGLVFFVAIILAGWLIRRFLDRYHLLQVPRMAFLLSLIVVGLLVSIVVAHQFDIPATSYIALFPMVILTGMIERFWTLEIEDGTAASFKTLLATMFMAWSISLVLDIHGFVPFLFRYPETIGLAMAGQLVLGRYTGYRFMELYRFREFMDMDPPQPEVDDHQPIDWGRWYVENEQDSPWKKRSGEFMGQ